MPRKQIYKITYPNGKIYVGMDLTGGRSTVSTQVGFDLLDQRGVVRRSARGRA
jgi:hypothetical protein